MLGIVLTDDGVYDELDDSEIAVNDWPRVYLRAEIDTRASNSPPRRMGAAWQAVGPALDATKLSDDYGQRPALHGGDGRPVRPGPRRHRHHRRLRLL